MGFMGKCLIHGSSVKIPNRGSAHDIQSKRTKYSKVHGSVCLFHKTGLFAAGPDAAVDCKRTKETLHEELAGKGENNCIKSHKGKVLGAFAILNRSCWIRAFISR